MTHPLSKCWLVATLTDTMLSPVLLHDCRATTAPTLARRLPKPPHPCDPAHPRRSAVPPPPLLQTVQTLLEGETGLLKITKKFNHRLHETVVRLYTTSGGTAKASGARGACAAPPEAWNVYALGRGRRLCMLFELRVLAT